MVIINKLSDGTVIEIEKKKNGGLTKKITEEDREIIEEVDRHGLKLETVKYNDGTSERKVTYLNGTQIIDIKDENEEVIETKVVEKGKTRSKKNVSSLSFISETESKVEKKQRPGTEN